MSLRKSVTANEAIQIETGFNGGHIMTITAAISEQTNSGLERFELRTIDPKTSKPYKFDSVIIEKHNFKGEIEGNYKDKIIGAGILLANDGNPDPKPIVIPTDVYDFEAKADVKMNKTHYGALVGKTIGIVASYKKVYPSAIYNGYTGTYVCDPKDITDIIRANPENVWLPNLDKDLRSKLEFEMFYDPDTELSWKEKSTGVTTPKAVKDKINRVQNRPTKENFIQEDWDALRLNKLEFSLSKANLTLDKSRFISVSGIAPDDSKRF